MKMVRGRKRKDNMLPSKKSPLWNCQSIYEQLLNPFTQTVASEYFIPILKRQLQYCRKTQQLLSLAIIKIPNLPNIRRSELNLVNSTLLRKIISTIRIHLRPTDMLFYDGAQEITLLFPKTKKDNVQKLLNRTKNALKEIYLGNNALTIKAGYAEFPTDSVDFIRLQDCAAKALNLAAQSQENRIIGYFTERRKYVRAPLRIEVRYTAPEDYKHITCSRNISEGGIMLSGIPDLPQGNNIKLTFKLPNIVGTKISVKAKTVWNKICQKTDKMDLGLCFTYINPTEKHLIKEFIQGATPPIIRP